MHFLRACVCACVCVYARTRVWALQLDFNVTNLNYFPLEVTRTHVFVAVSTVVAGSVQYNNSFSVAARSMSQVGTNCDVVSLKRTAL